MKQFLKNINWRRVGITLLIIYAVVWSYLYLAIQYAEHIQNSLNLSFAVCPRAIDPQKCVDSLQNFEVNVYWLFNQILGK